MEKKNEGAAKRIPLVRGTQTRPIIELEVEYEPEVHDERKGEAESSSGSPNISPPPVDPTGGPVNKP